MLCVEIILVLLSPFVKDNSTADAISNQRTNTVFLEFSSQIFTHSKRRDKKHNLDKAVNRECNKFIIEV